jgi:hypothetical protein
MPPRSLATRRSPPIVRSGRQPRGRGGPGRRANFRDNYNDPSVAALSTVLIAGTAAVIVLADRGFGLAKLI